MNLHSENNKIYAPYLLAASFNGLLKFAGSFRQGSVLYWKFYPKEDAQKLIEQLHTRTDPEIPSMDLFEAIDTWWKQVAELKSRNGEIRNGES